MIITTKTTYEECRQPEAGANLSLIVTEGSWQSTKRNMIALAVSTLTDIGTGDTLRATVFHSEVGVVYNRTHGPLTGCDPHKDELIFDDGTRIPLDDVISIHF